MSEVPIGSIKFETVLMGSKTVEFEEIAKNKMVRIEN